MAARSSGGRSASSCSGYDARPGPPGDVHTSASRVTRSGHVTAYSWATMPPKLTPTTAHRSQPTWSSSAGGVGGVVGHRERPGRHGRAPEAPLVVGDDVEVLPEAVDQRRARFERGARAVEEQQAAARSPARS